MVSRSKCVLGNLITNYPQSAFATPLGQSSLFYQLRLYFGQTLHCLIHKHFSNTTLTQMMAKEQLWTFWCSMNPRHRWLIKHVRMALRRPPHLVVKIKHVRHRPSVFTRSVTMPDPIHCDRPSALSIERISPSIAAVPSWWNNGQNHFCHLGFVRDPL